MRRNPRGPQIKGISFSYYVLPCEHIMRTSPAGLYSYISSGYGLSHFLIFVVVVVYIVECDSSRALMCEDVTTGQI